MSDFAIKVDRLGKQYQIRTNAGYRTLRESIAGGAKRLRGLLAGDKNAANGNKSDFWALKDVSLEVKRGEVLGIIGRNGAGKSTLLKVLSRITEPTEGEVQIQGRAASLLEVGTGFHPELTGRENIFLNGAILGMPRSHITKKFDEIVAFAEIERFLDTPVKRYSSGMYMRLAFAVAAHLEPEILIIDEVLAVGDAAFQAKCLGKMEDVGRTGRTVLFVSHQMPMIRHLCQRAVLLSAGKIVADGPAAQVVDEYLEGARPQAVDTGALAPITNENYGLSVLQRSAEVVEENGRHNLVVDFHLEAKNPLNSIGVGVWIESGAGIQISILDSRMLKSEIINLHGKRRCRLVCPDIGRFLGGGRYQINLWIDKPEIETILRVVDLPIVKLPAQDIYQCGRDFESPHYGIIPLPFTFEQQGS